MRAQVIAISLLLAEPVAAQQNLPPAMPPVMMPPDITRDDEYIRRLLMRAADQALVDRINHLFEIWMKDSTDQPRRALVGAHQAVNAYREIISALESQSWKIPPGPVSVFPPAERPPSVTPPAPTAEPQHRRRR